MHRTSAVALALFVSTAMLRLTAAPLPNVPLGLWFGNAPTDALRSDGRVVAVNGVVADYADGLQNVLAINQSTGNFRFSTTANDHKAFERVVQVDFGAQFADLGMSVPFSNGDSLQRVDILEAMHAYPVGDVDIQSLRYPRSVQKLVRFTWVDGGYYYRIGYGSDMDQNGIQDSPSVTVTCVAPADPTRACSRWALAPQDPAGTAALFRFRILKNGEGPAEPLGTFSLPFSQTFSAK